MARKLILIELNEVPFRVVDAYREQRPDSALARLLARSQQYQTLAADRAALDPWISWSTLHRGVNDEAHNIYHLGQVLVDVDAKYPPIWRILKEHGLNVGVFGSLHSSSLPPDVHQYSFYLPDYFGNTTFAHPQELKPFQELNLSMTRESARNVTRKIPIRSLLRFLMAAPKSGLKISTLKDAAVHLMRESGNSSLRIRRRAYQPLIMMDLFLKQLDKTKPHFATFYTNHVAAAMHRYWGASFPEDYGDERLDGQWVEQYRNEIDFSMDKMDLMLENVSKFIDRNPEYSLMVASSMGQAAIPAMKTYRFVTITDIARFMSALDVPAAGWDLKPAMVPCCCVVIRDEYRDRVLSKIATLALDGTAMRRDKRPLGPMSYDERDRGFFQFFVQFDNYTGPESASIAGASYKFPEIGLGYMAHEDGVNCTAQHVPAGSLWIYNTQTKASKSAIREEISTLDVAPSVLRYFGIGKLPYMHGSPSISFSD